MESLRLFVVFFLCLSGVSVCVYPGTVPTLRPLCVSWLVFLFVWEAAPTVRFSFRADGRTQNDIPPFRYPSLSSWGGRVDCHPVLQHPSWYSDTAVGPTQYCSEIIEVRQSSQSAFPLGAGVLADARH